jgi:hypothetical protein
MDKKFCKVVIFDRLARVSHFRLLGAREYRRNKKRSFSTTWQHAIMTARSHQQLARMRNHFQS